VFEVWRRIVGGGKLVDVEFDSILRSQDDVNIVSVDEWVRRCGSAVVHGRLHVLCTARPGGAEEKILVKRKRRDIRSTEVIDDCSALSVKQDFHVVSNKAVGKWNKKQDVHKEIPSPNDKITSD
jgi:hypothetical protein